MFNRIVVTKDNYEEHLKYVSPYCSAERSDQLDSLREDEARYLLRHLISFLEEIHSHKPHRVKAFIFDIFKRLAEKGYKNKRKIEVDQAVAAALAKRDKEKPTDGCTAPPRIIKDFDIRGVSLGSDGSIGICGTVRYVDMAEAIKPNPLFSGAVNAMLRGFITPSVPRDATIEQCRWYAREAIGALRLIDKDHPVLMKIEAAIDQHNKGVADKAKMEGVIAEMVRPSSIVKPTKTKAKK